MERDGSRWDAANDVIAKLYVDKPRPQYLGELPKGNEGLAELKNFVERAGVHRGAAVSTHTAGLRIIGPDHTNGSRIALGFFQDARDVLEALQLQNHPRTAINARRVRSRRTSDFTYHIASPRKT